MPEEPLLESWFVSKYGDLVIITKYPHIRNEPLISSDQLEMVQGKFFVWWWLHARVDPPYTDFVNHRYSADDKSYATPTFFQIKTGLPRFDLCLRQSLRSWPSIFDCSNFVLAAFSTLRK